MRQIGNVLLLGMPLLLTGCGGGGDFPTASVQGRVVCQGQPVPHVRVFFEPLQTGSSALVGKQAIATTDEQGTFVLSTYGNKDGAVVGKHRVRVGGPDRSAHPDFNCPCVLNSEVDVMEVEVLPKVKNEFELTLALRTARDLPSLDDLDD